MLHPYVRQREGGTGAQVELVFKERKQRAISAPARTALTYLELFVEEGSAETPASAGAATPR